MLWSAPGEGTGRETHSFPDYEDFRAQAKSFSALSAYVQASTVLSTNGDPIELEGLAATSDIFSVLGVAPLLGRAYTRAEDDPAARVVVLTYETWQRYFNGDPEDHRPAGAARAQSLHRDRSHAARVPVSGQRAKRISDASPAAGRVSNENSRGAFLSGSRPPAAGHHSGAGERGGERDRGAARKRVSRHQYRSQRQGCFVSSGSDGRRASGFARRSWPRFSLFSSSPAPTWPTCSSPAPPPASGRSRFAPRWAPPGPTRSATARRRSAPGIVRRGRRPPARLVERRSAAQFRSAGRAAA